MDAGLIKAYLGALALPPAGPLLLALLGLLMLRAGRRIGFALGTMGLVLLWLLSTHGVALLLEQQLLPASATVSLVDLRRARVQAVAVLGGGVVPQAPEYGQPQPSTQTLVRLRYGARLARQAGLPLAFAGGAGWSGEGTATDADGALAARQDFGYELRWVDRQSRDTHENAQRLAALLRASGVQRIALVTHDWHMPRAALEFRRAGLQVLPAPTGRLVAQNRPVLEWLPSAEGLSASRQVLREWAALTAARYLPQRRVMP